MKAQKRRPSPSRPSPGPAIQVLNPSRFAALALPRPYPAARCASLRFGSNDIGCAHEIGKYSTLRRSRGSFDCSTLEFDCSAFYGTTATGRPAVSLCRIALLRTRIRTFIYEEISLLTVLYFPFRVRTPNSQNNTDTLKHQNGLSNVVNDKGRYHSLSSPSTFAGSPVMLGRAAE